jgi:hypothetical protein
MCGTTSGKIRGRDVYLEVGYSGGLLEIGDMQYLSAGRPEIGVSRECVETILSEYSKEELIDLLLDFCDNAVEG